MLWERATLRPVHRAIVWQDRRTTARCDALRAEGREPWVRERTGLVLDPYFSATKLELLLTDAEIRRRAERGELAAGTVDSWLIARLTNGVAHVTDHTNASRTLLYDLDRAGVERRTLFALHRSPLTPPEDRLVERASSAAAAAEHFGAELPIAGIAGDQQAALFGQGCVTPGTAKNTYGTGAFLLQQAGAYRPAAPPGC